jgi:hypothetical protein
MGTCVPRQGTGGRRQPQVHTRVDLVFSLASDRLLELVARRRQVQCAAEANERSRDVERQLPLETLRLDLRLLAEPFRFEKCCEDEPEKEQQNAAACLGAKEPHQNRK